MNHHPTTRNGYGRKFLPSRATRRSPLLFTSLLTAFVFVFLISVAAADKPALTSTGSQAASIDWKAVEVALGKAGTMQPGDVYKVSLPRTDLKIMVGSIQLKPALALGSWIAFKKMGNTTMVMGDLVLTEDEVTRVMTKLQEGGVEQTALHNHVLHESPRVMYMHISALGDAVKIATAIHDALTLGGTPFTAPASVPNTDLEIDTKQLDQIMAQSGKVNSGVYQFSIPRAEKIFENGMEVPPSMGVATAINFQPTGGDKAAITGDFVLIASEVNPVIKVLRNNGIEVTALHSHMLDENPRLFFMHFWADDDRQKLARGLRAALDKMNIVRAQTK
ncbi:MAG TPA: DUF1259 domain-containing protein [Pyrinomonadaceae bacterium]|nr:DUF1259 domain-containing protein [Pyrinomonadaceae bacterium]